MKSLTAIVALSLVAALGPARSLADAPAYDTEKLADGLYAFRYGTARNIFLVGRDGVIVTDPISKAAAAALRGEIRKITPKPVRYVVYSHNHWDRVAGGEIFKAEGARFVAQEKCLDLFNANPNPAVIMPDVTFSDKYTASVGDRSLELYYFGPSHGDCLVAMLAEPANMMMIVDLVETPIVTFPADPTVPHIRPPTLIKVFSAMEKLAADRGVKTVIGANARMLRDASGKESVSAATGPVSLIAEHRIFWDTVIETTRAADKAGKIGMDSFVRLDEIDLTPFQKYEGYDKTALNLMMRRFAGYFDMGR